mgnify:CR=1 FL=1
MGGSSFKRGKCCWFALSCVWVLCFVHSVGCSEASARVGSSCAPNQRLNVWVCVSADLEALCLAQGRLYSFLCLNQLFGIVVSESFPLCRINTRFPRLCALRRRLPSVLAYLFESLSLCASRKIPQSSRIVSMRLAVSLSLTP